LSKLNFILAADLLELGVSPRLLWCIINNDDVRDAYILVKCITSGGFAGHGIYMCKETIHNYLCAFGTGKGSDRGE